MLKITSPTKMVVPSDANGLEKNLSYRDTSVDYQINKLRQSLRWKGSDPESYQERMNDLKSSQLKSLLFSDLDNQMWTYTGLHSYLTGIYGWPIENQIKYPEAKLIPWAKPPQHDPRYYQSLSVEKLLEARHAAIALPTGAGKSIVIFMLMKRLGLKTVVFTPSDSITTQLYDEAVELFGKKNVGIYNGKKKELKKLFTIATGASLTRIEEGTPAWEDLSKAKVLISDESHTTPAETFKQVCFGLLAEAPYRFFVSATQMRGDGSGLLLKGITGPIVYEKDFNDLVNEGFLAKPMFKTFRAPTVAPSATDPNKETRINFYNNQHINKLSAEIAENMVLKLNRPTVIIIDEIDQFIQLKNFLSNVPYEFVHGGASDGVKEKLPPEYWKPDKKGAIARFNSGETKILIGTSAIATGVDLRPTGCLIYLQGGKSEIAIKQGIGRGTRLVPGKKDFWVIDFNVPSSPTLQRHYNARKEIYETIGAVEEL